MVVREKYSVVLCVCYRHRRCSERQCKLMYVELMTTKLFLLWAFVVHYTSVRVFDGFKTERVFTIMGVF